ncbi:MAG: DEAD/DEAH box helicase, partial [Myxococcales bacterium]|nr:DEAD/DEAH box helicase [Myxococcales bacterium]
LPRQGRTSPAAARVEASAPTGRSFGWSRDPAAVTPGSIEVVDLSGEGSIWSPPPPRRHPPSPAERPGVVGRLVDLVDVSGELAPMARELLGETLVVEDLPRALELWAHDEGRVPLVTLEGDRLEPSGVVVGGSPTALDSALLQQKREIRELQEILEQLEGDFGATRGRHLGLAQRLALGTRVVVVGPVRPFRGKISMVHPEVYPADDPPPPIAVRYPVVEGVGARTVSGLCRKALVRLLETDALEDLLPPALARQHRLPPLNEALRLLHDPPASLTPDEVRVLDQGRSPAHRRLAFGELFLLQLLLLRRRSRWCADQAAFVTPHDAFEREVLRACLPFEPTAAQWRVIDEIERDMASGRPMLRLLQGDVGSGKTAVAFAAVRAVVTAGGQAALMAPTEILAEQHLRTLSPWCEAAGVRLALLTGAMPKGQRSSLLALLAAGQIDLVVGTHALLVDDVHFAGLGLVVVDEQHRFGVEQRALLRAKGHRPHLLVMTATPIPRTLALTAYGELEVSLIDQLPPGREPPVTRLLAGKPALGRARATLAKAVRRGAQAFVVCPLVEASEAIEATDVEATAAAIRQLLPDLEVGVVHGRMAPEDKDAVMEAFRSGRCHVLVATTVIEVGVDVPGARAILVEHAERFGLAQLHQLRGRIGRGGGASLCLVHTAGGPQSESAQRLEVLTRTADGFAVAEHDLAQRGPGEIFGTRQAGVPRLRFLGFAGEGPHMLLQARAAAQALLDADPWLHGHPRLRDAIEQRERDAPVYSADAG